MLHYKEHIEGTMHYVFVMDIMTGVNVSIDSTAHNFEQLRESIMETVNNRGSLEEVRNLIEESRSNNDVGELRKELGITINDDGTVSLPHGVTLPAGVHSVFNDIVDKEHGERLIKFAKSLSDNPREYSRQAMIAWIMTNPSLTILEDGRIRGFRGLQDDFHSIHSGYGIVNGVELKNAHLDNSPGNIIEFPVAMSDHNTVNSCSIGLHVGTWKYASSYGRGKYVSVAFSASDVVSPPHDAHQSKIRVSRMEILEEINKYEYDVKFLDEQ